MDQRICNICSRIDEILCSLTFPQFYWPVDEDGPDTTTSEQGGE